MFEKGQRLKPTSSRSVKLCRGLHGLAPLLGELVLELLLIGDCRLMDLLELSLKIENPLFLLFSML
jgi:hypothetical protein